MSAPLESTPIIHAVRSLTPSLVNNHLHQQCDYMHSCQHSHSTTLPQTICPRQMPFPIPIREYWRQWILNFLRKNWRKVTETQTSVTLRGTEVRRIRHATQRTIGNKDVICMFSFRHLGGATHHPNAGFTAYSIDPWNKEMSVTIKTMSVLPNTPALCVSTIKKLNETRSSLSLTGFHVGNRNSPDIKQGKQKLLVRATSTKSQKHFKETMIATPTLSKNTREAILSVNTLASLTNRTMDGRNGEDEIVVGFFTQQVSLQSLENNNTDCSAALDLLQSS